MIIEENQKENFRKYANHEAGHYIVARLLGFKTTDIKIIIKNHEGVHDASCVIRLDSPIENIKDVVDYCKKRIIILYAGAYSQALENNTIDYREFNQALKCNALSDHEKLWESLHIIRNIEFPKETLDPEINLGYANIKSELLRKSQQLVLENKDLILEIGDKLINGLINYDVQFVLSEEQLNSIPSIKNKFLGNG
jgi:hypothetical protein